MLFNEETSLTVVLSDEFTIEKNSFEDFRKLYPGVKRGLDTEFTYFKAKYKKDFKQILLLLVPAVERQIEEKKRLALANKFVPGWKHLKTYIHNRGWEEVSGTKLKVKDLPFTGLTLIAIRNQWLTTRKLKPETVKKMMKQIPRKYAHPFESTTLDNYFNDAELWEGR